MTEVTRSSRNSHANAISAKVWGLEAGSKELKGTLTGYENGKWDTTPPAAVKGTATETFTYQFSKIPVNEQVPDTADTSAEILWFSVTGMLMSAAALMLLYRSSEKRKMR